MLRHINQFASPKNFYALSCKLVHYFGGACLLLFVAGVFGGLLFSPPDYQQGESVRIIYVHVPSAWMSLFVYIVMAGAGTIGLIWRIKIMDVIARSSAPLGASFTFLALATGSLWGKPMWGAWWVWDARLTSELILLFLYLGYIALQSAIEDPRMAARAGAILALIGIINIPIIHFSVEWWSTLHQGPTVSKLDAPSIHIDMLIPLLLMALAYMCYFISAVLMRARCDLLALERNSAWVGELIGERSR
ncbi:MAG: heme ABC transporter permease [Gammaproteobacteria bacterium]|nr:heme ABC transporter permease [Gammaproteobacteria bacterium]